MQCFWEIEARKDTGQSFEYSLNDFVTSLYNNLQNDLNKILYDCLWSGSVREKKTNWEVFTYWESVWNSLTYSFINILWKLKAYFWQNDFKMKHSVYTSTIHFRFVVLSLTKQVTVLQNPVQSLIEELDHF